MNRLGIMQGSLAGPSAGADWTHELTLARSLGFECLELIDPTGAGTGPPLATPAGQARVREASHGAGVAVASVYAVWFQTHPFVRAAAAHQSERLEAMRTLLKALRGAGIGRVVLPCVDAGSITTTYDEMLLAEVLRALSSDLRRHGIQLHLQADLDPHRMAAFLARVPDPAVRVAYDTGISAAHGYATSDEMDAYGGRIGSVHVTDRVPMGTPVPLGEGMADLRAVFGRLGRMGYTGDLIVNPEAGPGADRELQARRAVALVDRLRREHLGAAGVGAASGKQRSVE